MCFFLQKVLFGLKQVERTSHYMRDVSKFSFSKENKNLSFLCIWYLGCKSRAGYLLGCGSKRRE